MSEQRSATRRIEKLELTLETVAELTASEAEAVAGGARAALMVGPSRQCPTISCEGCIPTLSC